MHTTTLSTKRAQALDRIAFSARTLAAKVDIDETFVDHLTDPKAKDPQIKELRRLEAVANFIEELARTAGIEEYQLDTENLIGHYQAEPTEQAEQSEESDGSIPPPTIDDEAQG